MDKRRVDTNPHQGAQTRAAVVPRSTGRFLLSQDMFTLLEEPQESLVDVKDRPQESALCERLLQVCGHILLTFSGQEF